MLSVETFCDSSINANTYLITNNNHVLIIDPANNFKTLQRFIGDKIVDGVILTHGHYDHFKTLKEVLDNYDTKCYLHKEAIKKLSDVNASFAIAFGVNKLPDYDMSKLVAINENTNLTIGSFTLKIWFTPGHTNCSIIVFVENLMFSGDTLFKNSIGRTDLLITWIYKMAMTNTFKDYGVASVLSILIFVVVAVVSLITYSRTNSIKKKISKNY